MKLASTIMIGLALGGCGIPSVSVSTVNPVAPSSPTPSPSPSSPPIVIPLPFTCSVLTSSFEQSLCACFEKCVDSALVAGTEPALCFADLLNCLL